MAVQTSVVLGEPIVLEVRTDRDAYPCLVSEGLASSERRKLLPAKQDSGFRIEGGVAITLPRPVTRLLRIESGRERTTAIASIKPFGVASAITELPDRPCTVTVVVELDRTQFELVARVDRDIGNVSVVGPHQNDCRRPDLFRTGLSDPSLALIQFLPSRTLPAESGLRSLSLPGNPSLVDSVIVTEELGFLSLVHASGGPVDTTMRLLELSPDDELVVLADSSADGTTRGRGSIDYAVQRGVYCHLLGPSEGVFTGQTDLVVELGWRAEE